MLEIVNPQKYCLTRELEYESGFMLHIKQKTV